MRDEYKHIQTEKEYNLLKLSGFFYEFHPELTGNWKEDEEIIKSEK